MKSVGWMWVGSLTKRRSGRWMACRRRCRWLHIARDNPSLLAQAAPPKRWRWLRRSQPEQQSPAGDRAQLLQAACDDERLKPLLAAARRTNMHFTHVRAHELDHVKPSSLTRQQAWERLERVYKGAHHDADSPTGSILRIGAVAKEQHQAAQTDECRAGGAARTPAPRQGGA